jgi:hypothetical protein
LGDVTDGSRVGSYDGYVDFEDLMVLSTCILTSEGEAGFEPEFDIGPTDDYSRTGVPEPDDVIDFEDLMIFAMNFWQTTPVVAGGREGVSEEVAILFDIPGTELELPVVSVGEEVEVRVVMRNGEDLVKGMDIRVECDGEAIELVEVTEGELLKSSGGSVFFKAGEEEEGVEILAAALGTGATFSESGEVARLRVRMVKEGEVELRIGEAKVRGSGNERLECGVQEMQLLRVGRTLPKSYALHQNYPNPFTVGTDIRYQIPEGARVSLKVYDAAGKLVRTLVDEAQEAGYYRVHWDRKDEMGTAVAAGVYFYRLTTEGESRLVFTRKTVSLR